MEPINKITGDTKQAVFQKNDKTSEFQSDLENDLIFDSENRDKNQYNKNTYLQKDDFNTDDWEDIKPKKDKFLGFLWETDTYTYSSSDGSKITVENTQDVIIKQNKQTGDIVVIGANGAKIKGSDDNIGLYIIDSNISSVETGGGDDNITIVNSKIKDSILTSKGSDSIKIYDSETDSVNSGKGEDKVEIYNSSIDKITTAQGADKVVVENSQVNDSVKTGENVDDVIINSSTINSIDTGSDSDRILMRENSNAENVSTAQGADVVDVLNSDIENLYLKQDENTAYLSNSNIGKIQGGNAQNNIINDNSNINNLEGKNTTQTEGSASLVDIQNLDEVSSDTAINITQKIGEKYAGEKYLTSEQQTQASVINFFQDNMETMEAQFNSQNQEDGLVVDSYNLTKILLDIGISSEDIENAIKEQETMINEMNSALIGESAESFEDCFKRWTGIEYNQENMIEFMETYQKYQLAITGLNKTAKFQQNVEKANNFQEVFDSYVEYYGSEERAREELNKNFKENAVGNQEAGFPSEMYINENNELVRKLPKSYSAIGPDENSEYETIREPMDKVVNMFATMPRVFNVNDAQDKFKENFENTMNVSFDELQNQYITQQLKATGNGSSYQRLIDEYCEENSEFIDKVASITQTTGMITMIGGAVVCIACPPAAGIGIGILETGKTLAISGMFMDEGLELLDELTSGNISQEDLQEIFKETITDLALFYSGRGINVVSSGIHNEVENAVAQRLTEKLGSEGAKKWLSWAAGTLAEIGVDAPMSLCADYIITGDVNLTGEGISQLMCIITGISGSKINQYKTEIYENAQKIALDGDIKAAEQYLKSKHMSAKDIKAAILPIEYENAYKIYQTTGNTDALIKYVNGSDILKSQSNDIVTSIIKNFSEANDVEVNGQKESILTDGQKEVYRALMKMGYSDTASFNCALSPKAKLGALKYFSKEFNSVEDVMKSLDGDKKITGDALYKRAQDLGYNELFDRHPEIFKQMLEAESSEYPMIYSRLTPEQFEIIKYVVSQADNAEIPIEYVSATNCRVKDSVPYEIFKYIDNPDAIPDEGIQSPFNPDMYFTKEECLLMLKEQAIPLREFLDTQSIPKDINVTRSDSSTIVQNIKIGNENMGDLLKSDNPEDIQKVIDSINNNGAEIEYKNFVGTRLDDSNYDEHYKNSEVVWHLNIPKGSSGAFLAGMGAQSGAIYTEGEFLLQAGTKFEISSAKYENGTWIFEANVVQE